MDVSNLSLHTELMCPCERGDKCQGDKVDREHQEKKWLQSQLSKVLMDSGTLKQLAQMCTKYYACIL